MLLRILCFIAFTLLFQQTFSQHVSGQYLVQFQRDVNPFTWTKTNTEFEDWNFQIEDQLSKTANIWLLSYHNNDIDIHKGLSELRLDESIVHAQLNHNLIKHRATTPNDLDYPVQWAVNGSGDAKINAPSGWDYHNNGKTKNGNQIVVAVIDDGFQIDHADINYYVNSQEITGNNVDDDLNGFVDDVKGWNAYQDNGILPELSHGTHVAGIVGAKTNNGAGVAGVGWGAEVLAIAGSSNLESVVIKAYDYALEMRKLYDKTNGVKGAFVVATNSSFGIDFGKAEDYPIWCGFYDTLGAYGIINVVATSNSSNVNVDNLGDIPSTCQSRYIIAVTNLNEQKFLLGAYGKEHIDIAAPGTSIFSTDLNNSGSYKTGTSMAAPHVSGAIALLYQTLPISAWNELTNPEGMALFILNDLLENGYEPLTELDDKVNLSRRLDLGKAAKSINQYQTLSSLIKVTDDYCNTCTGKVELTAKPLGVEVDWGQGFDTILSNDQFCKGIFPVSITDAYSRSLSLNIDVNASDSLKVQGVVQLPSSGSNGNVDLQVQGGNAPYSYLWSTGDTTQDISGVIFGVYRVTVTDSNNCIVSAEFNMEPVGLEDQDGKVVRMYPNPVTSELIIEFAKTGVKEISIYDLVGKKVSFFEDITSKSLLNLEGLNNGTYVISIKYENNNKINRKIIVNKP